MQTVQAGIWKDLADFVSAFDILQSEQDAKLLQRKLWFLACLCSALLKQFTKHSKHTGQSYNKPERYSMQVSKR